MQQELDKRILLLAFLFPPDNSTGAARPGRFAKYLPTFGYRVDVISAASASANGPGNVIRVPKDVKDRNSTAAMRITRKVQRFLLPYDDQLPWAAAAFSAGSRAIQHTRPAVILSTAPPVGVHLAALALKRKFGVPWVADFRDPLQDNPFRTRRWIFPYDQIVERQIFRHADAAIANTDAVADVWIKRYPQFRSKIHVIWNGFDPGESIEPEFLPARPYRIVAHVGTLYGGRHPGPILECLHRLVQNGLLSRGAIRLLLTGIMEAGCLDRNPVAVEALKRWEMLEIRPPVPQAEARHIMASSDYLLLIDTNEKNVGLQVPAKLFEYIRVGRPMIVLTTPGSPTERVVRSSGVPHVCVTTDAGEQETDAKILELLSHQTDPVRPTSWFFEQFDGIRQAETLARLIDRVAAANAHT